jgi:hypothetical protein
METGKFANPINAYKAPDDLLAGERAGQQRQEQ